MNPNKDWHLQHRDHVRAFNYRNCKPLHDSVIETTRVYWRKRLLPDLPDDLAADPRPLAEVLKALKNPPEPTRQPR